MALTGQSWTLQIFIQAVGCVPQRDETTEGAILNDVFILQASYTLRGILQHEGTPASGLHVVGMP